jgi:hypothetical protein
MRFMYLGIACVEPPIPPVSAHLIRHYDGGDTTPFGAKINYSCELGYFFGKDKEMITTI